MIPAAQLEQAARTLFDARVRAVLRRGMIWDEFEFTLLRNALPGIRSDAEAMRIEALMHAYEHGEAEDAAA